MFKERLYESRVGASDRFFNDWLKFDGAVYLRRRQTRFGHSGAKKWLFSMDSVGGFRGTKAI